MAVSTLELNIKAALLSLLSAIKAADGSLVAIEMERLDKLLAEGKETLHPQLLHFLQNRSYAKALLYLGGETNIPVGVCGGKASRG